ncbi:MAG: PEP-CTERM sorting domain-containing protein [Anaerohalosphaera sp.]|nr:PEP-CTERM sorting domain-containing protein [Anaerohalosphaera sp.]
MKKVIVLSVLCLLVGAANAGLWTVTVNNDLGTALDTSGTLFKASNLGLGATAQTIGGIAYDVDYSNLTGTDPASHSMPAKFYTGTDTSLDNLLNNGGKVSVWPAQGGRSLNYNFSGLTIGYDYRFQLILGGDWGGCAANLYGDTAGANDYKYVYFGNGTTEKVATYTWTATATDITIQSNAGSGQASHYGLAYSVHEIVPEPATMALLGLGSLIALKRRK